MMIVALEEAQFKYLMHVFEQHSRAGLPANELPIASEVYLRIAHATSVSDKNLNLGKATVTEMTPNSLAVEVNPQPDPDVSLRGDLG